MGLDFHGKGGIWIEEVGNLGAWAWPLFFSGPKKANSYHLIFFG
jgi:hypothetical protein